MKKISPLYLIFSLFCSQSVNAFTLQEAWAAAKEYSADYQSAQFQRDASMEQRKQARAAFLPHIAANANYQHQPPSVSSTKKSKTWNIQLSQTLFDASKMAQYRQSKYNSQAAEQRFNAKSEDLLLKVSETYFNLLLSKDTVSAHASEKAAYAQQVKQAQEMFKRGAAVALDIHEAQAGYDNALAQEIAAIAEKQVLENQLNNYTGLDSKTISPVRTQNLIEQYLPKFQQYSLAEWQQMALLNNPEYQTQLLTVRSAEEAINVAKNSRFPTVTANVGYQSLTQKSSNQSRNYRYHGEGPVVSVQLSLPLYTGGELSSKIRENSARYESENAQLIEMERKIKLAVRQAHTEGNATHYQILAQERVLASSRLKLKSTETGQQHGMRNRLEVIRARQEVAQAEQKLAQVRYRFLIAYLTLVKESGLGVESIENI